MKLTEENQDYMDCRPGGRDTGVTIPSWLREVIKEAQAARAGSPDTESAKRTRKKTVHRKPVASND